jgi:glycosyltransferase involved in cell wall biosynthesis
MKLSIITVVYNNEQTIADALKSVSSQTFKDIEHIVIDGASTDGTKEILADYARRIALLISEPDSGIYDAMNKGIKVATGDVIGILNSDDLYADETVLASVMDEFMSNPSLDIVYGDLVYVKKEQVDKVVRKWHSKPYGANFFEGGDVPPHPSLFVRRKVYEECGLFNLDYTLAADYEFMLRVFKKHAFKSKYIHKVIVKMRLGGATNQSLSNIKRQNIEILNAWENNNLKVPFLLMPLRFLKRLIQFI